MPERTYRHSGRLQPLLCHLAMKRVQTLAGQFEQQLWIDLHTSIKPRCELIFLPQTETRPTGEAAVKQKRAHAGRAQIQANNIVFDAHGNSMARPISITVTRPTLR